MLALNARPADMNLCGQHLLQHHFARLTVCNFDQDFQGHTVAEDEELARQGLHLQFEAGGWVTVASPRGGWLLI